MLLQKLQKAIEDSKNLRENFMGWLAKENCRACQGKGFYPVPNGPDDYDLVECEHEN